MSKVFRRRSTKVIDGSSDDDDPGTYDDQGMFHSAPLPKSQMLSYNSISLPAVRCSMKSQRIDPPPRAQAYKEVMRLLSGRFTWDEYINGRLTVKCPIDNDLLENAKERKRESSWQASVTRRSARSIEEATQPKDLKTVYDVSTSRKHLMEDERRKAHELRRQRKPGQPWKHLGQAPLLPPVLQRSSNEHDACSVAARLLLLNDDMLQQEASRVLLASDRKFAATPIPQKSSSPVDELVRQQAASALGHRSLLPLAVVLKSTDGQRHVY